MSDSAIVIPTIGQPWAEQGGIYIGVRLIDGVETHVVIPGGPSFDILASYNNAAQRIAALGGINGYDDWRHGSLEDMMLAYINVPDLFPRTGVESVQITSTPHDDRHAWAIGFGFGLVRITSRSNELRVRPFRSVVR